MGRLSDALKGAPTRRKTLNSKFALLVVWGASMLLGGCGKKQQAGISPTGRQPDLQPNSAEFSKKADEVTQKPVAMPKEFQNRKQYRHLTKQILQSIPDGQLEEAVLDYVDFKVVDNFEHEYRIVKSLSK